MFCSAIFVRWLFMMSSKPPRLTLPQVASSRIAPPVECDCLTKDQRCGPSVIERCHGRPSIAGSAVRHQLQPLTTSLLFRLLLAGAHRPRSRRQALPWRGQKNASATPTIAMPAPMTSPRSGFSPSTALGKRDVVFLCLTYVERKCLVCWPATHGKG